MQKCCQKNIVQYSFTVEIKFSALVRGSLDIASDTHFVKSLWVHNPILFKIQVICAWKMIIWWGHNFAHVYMTTQLLWHTKICDLIESTYSQLQQRIFARFQLWAHKPFQVCEMGSWSLPPFHHGVAIKHSPHWLLCMKWLCIGLAEINPMQVKFLMFHYP